MRAGVTSRLTLLSACISAVGFVDLAVLVLVSALSRLMAVSEAYPNLRANQAFQDLRVQLEGTENRITVARNRYIKTVQEYNVLARSFPTNLTAMMFSYPVKPNFTVQNEAQISAPPTVSFDKPASK